MGCARNAFALVGCGTVLIVTAGLAWWFRPQLVGIYHSVRGDSAAAARDARATEAATGTGRPSAEALRSARRKEAAMARTSGPASVTLTADEMASIVVDGLDPAARRVLDSITVVLHADRFVLQAVLLVRSFGRDRLGPFGGALDDREALRLGGGARVTGPGVAAWEPDEFVLRAFPFPRAAVPALVNQLTGRRDGVMPLRVPATVGAVRIESAGVTFFRKAD